MADDPIQAALQKLLRRRDPTAEVFFEVEMLHEAGLHALLRVLDDPGLPPHLQYRALQGLPYTAKDLGLVEHDMVIEAAIRFCASPNQMVRSKGAHMAICGLSLRKGFFPSGPDDSIPGQVALAERVTRAVADAVRLGFEKQVAHSVAEFLYGHHI